jgi:hypothetical protein
VLSTTVTLEQGSLITTQVPQTARLLDPPPRRAVCVPAQQQREAQGKPTRFRSQQPCTTSALARYMQPCWR